MSEDVSINFYLEAIAFQKGLLFFPLPLMIREPENPIET